MAKKVHDVSITEISWGSPPLPHLTQSPSSLSWDELMIIMSWVRMSSWWKVLHNIHTVSSGDTKSWGRVVVTETLSLNYFHDELYHFHTHSSSFSNISKDKSENWGGQHSFWGKRVINTILIPILPFYPYFISSSRRIITPKNCDHFSHIHW